VEEVLVEEDGKLAVVDADAKGGAGAEDEEVVLTSPLPNLEIALTKKGYYLAYYVCLPADQPVCQPLCPSILSLPAPTVSLPAKQPTNQPATPVCLSMNVWLS
jgi:hypothetical protein